MFENILVCLDGTKFSEEIIPTITDFAVCSHSRITLLNVVIAPSLLAGYGQVELEYVAQTEFSESERAAASYLDHVAIGLEEKGLDVQCVTVEGQIEETILACAREYNASLIALAGHRHGFISKLFHRSITDFLQRNLRVPILSISPESTNPNTAN